MMPTLVTNWHYITPFLLQRVYWESPFTLLLSENCMCIIVHKPTTFSSHNFPFLSNNNKKDFIRGIQRDQTIPLATTGYPFATTLSTTIGSLIRNKMKSIIVSLFLFSLATRVQASPGQGLGQQAQQGQTCTSPGGDYFSCDCLVCEGITPDGNPKIGFKENCKQTISWLCASDGEKGFKVNNANIGIIFSLDGLT